MTNLEEINLCLLDLAVEIVDPSVCPDGVAQTLQVARKFRDFVWSSDLLSDDQGKEGEAAMSAQTDAPQLLKKEVWNDISSETFREYLYADGSKLRIDNPTKLFVSPSSMGGHAHRVQTAEGFAYYVAPGWKTIRWQVKEGQPLFTF